MPTGIGSLSDAISRARLMFDGSCSFLVRVDLGEAGAQLQCPLVREQQHPLRIVQPRLEHLRQPFRAALDDAHERQALVVVGRRDDVVEHLRDPVDRLRDERHVLHAERHRQRIERARGSRRAASCCSWCRCGDVGDACFLVSP